MKLILIKYLSFFLGYILLYEYSFLLIKFKKVLCLKIFYLKKFNNNL